MNSFNPSWIKSQSAFSSSQIQVPYTNTNYLNTYHDATGTTVNNYTAGSLLLSDTSDTITPSSSCTSFKHSSDSLNSFGFEDYRIANTNSIDETNLPYNIKGTYVYFKCAIPTSKESFTFEFIKNMCCNCGRG